MYGTFRFFLASCAAVSAVYASAPLKAGYGIVPPLSFHIQGKPAGFTIDVINEAARREGLSLDWKFAGNSLEIERSLAGGVLDVVPAGMVTARRRQTFYVSAPWWFAELSLMTREEVANAPGKSIGLGSPVYNELADQAFPGVPQVPFPDALRAEAALCEGEVDSVLLMHMDIHRLFLYHPREAGACRKQGVRIAETRANVELAVLARRGMEGPARRLRRRIDDMAIDGTLARLAARYPDIPSSGVVKLANDIRVRYARRHLWQAIIFAAIVVLLSALFVSRLLRQVRSQRRAQERLARAHRIAFLGDWQYDLATRRLDLSEGAKAFCPAATGNAPTLDVFVACAAAEDAERVRAALERAAAGNPVDISYGIDQPERGRRHVRLNAEPVRASGRVACLAGTIQDLTDHRRLEEQLQQSQKMEVVGRLAGGVAHDFNNLLTVIGGYADMVLETLPPGDRLRHPVASIAESAERAAALTRQLLAFSRREHPEPKVLSLNELVQNLEKMLRRLIGEDIRLELDLDPSTPFIRADPGQLEQVVTNLVVNARDAMPEGGRISIRTRPRTAAPDTDGQSYAELIVADTGAGIAPEVLPHIFEPFFTTKEQGKGTGLGLAIVHGIVRQNNGSIDVRSSPRDGTAFELLLPAVPGQSPGSPEPEGGRQEDLSGNETLLVAEDEPGVRGFVSAALRSRGYSVIEAASGREALELFSRQDGRIDLLLTDIVMPDMGGVELATRVRRLRPDLPVLYMSGYTDQSMPTEVTQNLLGKPFPAADLLRRIQQVLATQGRRGG